ncbi:MAG TPA: hypothetical protein VD770_00785, partial [Coxiellaceae bacterium]|nr:hypothetical protein [Coxiellaceae bacterium]
KYGLIFLLFLPSLAFADIAFNTTTLMTNIGILAKIVQTVSVVMGVGLVFMGIMKLKHYGEMRSMMNTQGNLGQAIFTILAGVILLALPTMLSSFLLAFWGTANPLPYPTNNDPGVNALLPPIIMFVRLVGVISFIRGVILLSHLGKEGGYQQGSLGKALIFMIGGILCVHIVGTAQLLESILGFTGI